MRAENGKFYFIKDDFFEEVFKRYFRVANNKLLMWRNKCIKGNFTFRRTILN